MEVCILTTGGTFDKLYFDAASEYRVGEPQIKEILLQARVGLSYQLCELMRKDSLDMQESDRRLIVDKIQKSECSRFVIVHGTDTMIDTARSLQADRAIVGDRVIVLTGSMSPARFVESDAKFNAGFALAAAQTLQNGVYLAINGKIFSPNDVRKNRRKGVFETTSC